MKCSQEGMHLRKAFAPFSTCSVASRRRNVASSTRAISTVSELQMAPTASPLNFALVVSSTWKIRPCRLLRTVSGQATAARLEIFTATNDNGDDDEPRARFLSRSPTFSPFHTAFCSPLSALSCPPLPSPFPSPPSLRSNRHTLNCSGNLLPRQRTNSRI